MKLLRLWLAASAIVLAAIVVWAFAPMLVFVALLTALLGGIAAAMIAIASWLRALRERQ